MGECLEVIKSKQACVEVNDGCGKEWKVFFYRKKKKRLGCKAERCLEIENPKHHAQVHALQQWLCFQRVQSAWILLV